jgi:hypothetical protein
MNNDDNKHSGQFNASLHLPGDDRTDGAKPAADLIRKKVDAAYAHEPSAKEEIEEVKELGSKARHSKHQEFIYELTNAGRPLHEVQTAWHEYYAGLTDAEKHQVWQEFYSAQTQQAHHPAMTHAEPKPDPLKHLTRRVHSKVIKHTTAKLPKPNHASYSESVKHRAANPIHSLLFGLGVGSIVILIFLFGFFNDRIIAPFIQPGDTFYLQKDGKRYTYQVYKRTIVKPTDVSVLGLSDKTATATLITCDPPGTSNNRLVVTGEQISPDIASNVPLASHNAIAQTAAVVPGNSLTLWSRLVNWFVH